MIDAQTRQRVLYQLLFTGLTLCFLFLHILPLNALPSKFPGPDMVLCFTLVWVLRRPDFLPPVLLVALLLLCDFVLQRPPGLWAMIVLLAAEFQRSRFQGEGEIPFLAEWAISAAIMTGATLLNDLTLYVVGVAHSSVAFTVVQVFMNIAFYPVAVGVSVFGAGLRRPAPSDFEARGGHA